VGEQRVEKNKEEPFPAKDISQFMLEHSSKWGVKGIYSGHVDGFSAALFGEPKIHKPAREE